MLFVSSVGRPAPTYSMTILARSRLARDPSAPGCDEGGTRGRMTSPPFARLARYHRRFGTRRTVRAIVERLTRHASSVPARLIALSGRKPAGGTALALRRSGGDELAWPEPASVERVVFRRGWLASSLPLQHDIADPENGWSVVALGAWELRIHPDLSWSRASKGPATVVLLGDAVDVEAATIDAGLISGRLLDAYLRSGARAAIRYAAYLGGRFTALIWSGEQLLVVPDAVASLPTYWARKQEGVVLSSWSHLVAELAQSQVNEGLRDLLQHARTTGGMSTVFAPGIETPFLGVYPLLPNHLLVWDRLCPDTMRHERFYPWPDEAVESGSSDPYAVFADIFSEHTRLLCQLGRVGISLTAGLDSNATLAAAWPWLGADAFRGPTTGSIRRTRACSATSSPPTGRPWLSDCPTGCSICPRSSRPMSASSPTRVSIAMAWVRRTSMTCSTGSPEPGGGRPCVCRSATSPIGCSCPSTSGV